MIKKLTTTIPPLRGRIQDLNIPLKQVKTVRLEKINGEITIASRRNRTEVKVPGEEVTEQVDIEEQVPGSVEVIPESGGATIDFEQCN